MDDKYYIPTIEELHHGFELQTLHKNKWVSACVECFDSKLLLVYNFQGQQYRIDFWHHSKTRVKYLDKEDIESLGWKPDKINQFEFGDYVLNINSDKIRIYVLGDYDNEKTSFKGIIRNRSELNKLMQQLNIKSGKK